MVNPFPFATRWQWLLGAIRNEIENILLKFPISVLCRVICGNWHNFDFINKFFNVESRRQTTEANNRNEIATKTNECRMRDHKLNGSVRRRLHRQIQLTLYRIVYGNAPINQAQSEVSVECRPTNRRKNINFASMECKYDDSLNETLQSFQIVSSLRMRPHAFLWKIHSRRMQMHQNRWIVRFGVNVQTIL